MRGVAIGWWAGLLLPFALSAAEAPAFTGASVLPANAARQEPLWPFMLVSIYGRHLGPATGCAPERGTYPEPTELCGASVTVGGVKAGLLYVQDRQINLRVPANATGEGMIDFAVTYQGRSSVAVPVRFGPMTATIRLTGPAYTHMPIWVHVDLPDPQAQRTVRYPVTIWPADLGGNQLEVRRNGIALPPVELAHTFPKSFSGPGGYGTIGDGSLLGLPHQPKNLSRLPLHLIYRFDKAGFYEVRYLGRAGRDGRGEILARSGWLRFQVLDSSPSKRALWLASMRASAPSDPVELLSDFLPSILAAPDSGVLSILEEYLGNSSDLVREYSMYALYQFDDALLAKEIPRLIEERGAADQLAYFLSWRRDLFQPQREALVGSLLKHLDSAVPLVIAGALQALYFLKGGYDWKEDPEAPALMDREIAARANRLIDTRNFTILQPLALYLGIGKTDQSRELLWRIVEQGGPTREQALICLTWIGDLRDLPELGRYNTGNIDYHLDRAYGKAAAPYLKGGR